MLNPEKIKLMNQLAMYEQGEGKKYLPISRYYRRDYIGAALIRNLFLVAVGYVLTLAGVGAYFSEYLMNNIHKMNLTALGVYLLLGFLALFSVYTVLTYIIYSVKYFKAKKSVRHYYDLLTQMEKMYGREERRSSRN
ncbi:MAG: hypothetical protein IJ899_15335 [Blautia sp.]|nr:hypothetical protein [Blautia sp.]